MPDRAEVLRFADHHGAKQAADHYGLSAGTIRSWRSRARRRAGREAADRERAAERRPPSPLAEFERRAEQAATWAARGACRRCGGCGYLTANTPEAIARASVLAALQYAKRIVCPDCGGPERRPVVVGTATSMALRALQADAQDTRADEHHAPGGHPEAWRQP